MLNILFALPILAASAAVLALFLRVRRSPELIDKVLWFAAPSLERVGEVWIRPGRLFVLLFLLVLAATLLAGAINVAFV